MTTQERPTVLVVEDDRASRELYEYALRLAGFDVLLATDGLGALRMLEHELPDAIVLDLDLPWISGIDVQQEIVSHAETSTIPIIVVTGTEWSPRSPVYALLRKPVTVHQIVETVRRAIGESSGSSSDGTPKHRR